MNRKIWSRVVRLARADFFSPQGLLVRACIIMAVFLALHLAGLRDDTSVLNGTVGSTATSWNVSVIFGVAYLLFYMASVVLVPVLVLAAGMLAIGQKWKFLATENDVKESNALLLRQ